MLHSMFNFPENDGNTRKLKKVQHFLKVYKILNARQGKNPSKWITIAPVRKILFLCMCR